ncbi:MAG: HD domain-containing phosphohydrolase, partial [Gemmatimonadota bacterium]
VPEEGDPKNTADILRWSGMVHAERGSLDEAVGQFESSLAAAEAGGLKEQMAAALICIANVELLRGKLDDAADLFLKGRETAEDVGHDRLVAQIDQNLGTIANIQGNVAIALLSYRSALERYRRLGDDFTATRALNNMGMAHVDLSEWEAAETCFTEASEIAAKNGDTMMVGRVELNRAELHLKRRRYEAAQESVDRSLQVFHRLRTKPSIAEAYKYYGMLYRETGKPEQSDTHFALSLGMAEACQNRLLQAETQMEWALLHLEEERKQEGILYLNRSLQIFQDLKASREVLDIERRLNRLKEMYLPAVRGWGSQLTEGKDPFQVGHAQRVADYATKLAREVGVDGWDLTYIRIGAFIHDLGNMAVPAEVLNKADVLNDDERELMKVHTIMGDSMAKQLDFPDQVRPVVRSHHEQWAGSGYPDKLVGDEIPFGARVVGIADVFDALTSPRSFRDAFSQDEALQIMKKDSETMFDPNLFGTFMDMTPAVLIFTPIF